MSHKVLFWAQTYFPYSSVTYQQHAVQIVPQSCLLMIPQFMWWALLLRTNISQILSSTLRNCSQWMSKNQLQLNLQKTKCMLLHSVRKNPPPLRVELQNTPIEQVTCFKFLGVNINEHLSWDNHIVSITNKVSRNINLLRRMSWFLPRPAMLLFYNSYILPLFDYCMSCGSAVLMCRPVSLKDSRTMLDA